jgi:hypothetical protein
VAAEANAGGDEPNLAPPAKHPEICGFPAIAIQFQRLNAWVKRFIVPEDGFCCLVNFLQQSSTSQRDAGGSSKSLQELRLAFGLGECGSGPGSAGIGIAGSLDGISI